MQRGGGAGAVAGGVNEQKKNFKTHILELGASQSRDCGTPLPLCPRWTGLPVFKRGSIRQQCHSPHIVLIFLEKDHFFAGCQLITCT